MLDCRHDLLARFECHAAVPDLASPEINYEQLHEFRYLIRRFLRFSEEAAREDGIESQQHQLLLAIKGMQQSLEGISVTTAAERLQVSHNTAVELVDRTQAAGLVVRSRSEVDRRLVRARLTPYGEDCLDRLSSAHLAELRSWAPELIGALSALLSPPRSGADGPANPDVFDAGAAAAVASSHDMGVMTPTPATPTPVPTASSPAANSPTASSANAIALTLTDNAFSQKAFTVADGSKVTFQLSNQGKVPHASALRRYRWEPVVRLWYSSRCLCFHASARNQADGTRRISCASMEA